MCLDQGWLLVNWIFGDKFQQNLNKYDDIKEKIFKVIKLCLMLLALSPLLI